MRLGRSLDEHREEETCLRAVDYLAATYFRQISDNSATRSDTFRPKGLEVWKGKLILYGCGDFLNDYEGIEGYEEFRGDLAVLYLPTLDLRSGRLLALQMHPLQMRRLRLSRATPRDARWIGEVLPRESAALDTEIRLDADRCLRWARFGIDSA